MSEVLTRRLSRRAVLRAGLLVGLAVPGTSLLAACGSGAVHPGGAGQAGRAQAGRDQAGRGCEAGRTGRRRQPRPPRRRASSRPPAPRRRSSGSPAATRPATRRSRSRRSTRRTRASRSTTRSRARTRPDLHDKFVTVAGAKDPSVDIVSMDVPFVPEFAAAGWTIPVDDILPKDEQAKFFQGTLHGATYEGKLWGVPWFNNGPGLYYRKDLFDAKGLKPPKTYDELLNAAKTLQTADMAGFAMQLPQTEGGIISWMEYLWGYGGDLVDDKLNVVVDQGTAGVDGMQKILDFVYKDKIIPEAALQFKLGADVMNLFRGGKAAMIRLWFSNAGDLVQAGLHHQAGAVGCRPAPLQGRREARARVPRRLEPRRLQVLHEAEGGAGGDQDPHQPGPPADALPRRRLPARPAWPSSTTRTSRRSTRTRSRRRHRSRS